MKKINNLSHRELATISGGSATSIGAAIGGFAGTAYCYTIISELGFSNGYGISKIETAIYAACGGAGALVGAVVAGTLSCIFKNVSIMNKANTMKDVGIQHDGFLAIPAFPAMPKFPDATAI